MPSKPKHPVDPDLYRESSLQRMKTCLFDQSPPARNRLERLWRRLLRRAQ